MERTASKKRRTRWLLVGEFAAVGATAVILLVFLASSLDGLLIRGGQGAAVVTAILIELANTDRGMNHVTPLTVDPVLTAVAQAKANDMAAKGYFAHTSPDGHDPWYWFTLEGYSFTYAGENLAVDFSDSATVEEAWMNSPEHRANLLNPHYTQVGIAIAAGTYEGHPTTFVVQEFGTPAPSGTASSVVVATVPTAAEVLAEASSTPAKNVASASVQPPTPSKPSVATPAPAFASSTGAVTAITAPTTPSEPTPMPTGLIAFWNVFASSPQTTLRYAYYLFGLLILIALIFETGFEVKKHHTRHVALAVALIALMSGLFLTADRLVFTTPQITDSGASTGPAA